MPFILQWDAQGFSSPDFAVWNAINSSGNPNSSPSHPPTKKKTLDRKSVTYGQCSLGNTSTFTYPLTIGSLEHQRWLHNLFPPLFSVLWCSLGLGELQACAFPDVFPPLLLSALSSLPFHWTLHNGYGHTWWLGDMSIPLQFASLHDGREVFM